MSPETLEKRIRYVDPEKKTYSEYFDSILAFNRKLQEEVSSNMKDAFEKIKDGFTIVTTGSDARLEKGPQSLIEIVLLTDNYCECNDVISTLLDYTKDKNEIKIFENKIEIKDLSGEMYYYILNENTPEEIKLHSPNRILDAKMLFGNEYIFQKAKKKLAKEFDSEKLKKIKDRTKQHLKISSSGIQQYNKETTLVHYDIENGIVNYNPDKKLWSFKQGPIRTIQYALVRDVMKNTIENYHTSHDLLYLPQNTVEKLNDIEISGFSALSHEAINDLTDSYKYFLWEYHKSQKQYNLGICETSFLVSEVKERLKSVEDICKNQIIKI